MSKEVDYGPLEKMIGHWQGDKGLDVAPEPDGPAESPYYEKIIFTAAGDVENAESQLLAVIHYHQIVYRKSNNEMFHNETGYWMWDAETQTVMHSLTIPRAVCVLAGGVYNNELSDDGAIVLEVSADLKNSDWQIIQSPFMDKNAKTTAFSQRIEVSDDALSYRETTLVDIYGKSFEHTDQNRLQIQR